MNKLLYQIIIFSALFLISNLSFAQDFPTDKDSKILFGNIAFSSMGGDIYNSGEERTTTLMATPGLTYFITPGLAIGGKGLLSRSAQGKNSTTIFGIGPHIAYFINGKEKPTNIKGTTYSYIGASFLFTNTNYTYKSGIGYSSLEERSISGTTLSFGFGIMHMLSNSVGLTSEFSYEIDKVKGENSDNTASGNKINIIIGISAFLY